jgi:hypothetical protein
MWLTQLIKVNAMRPHDVLYSNIDDVTYNYCLENYLCFKAIILEINHVVFIEKQPTTNMEGMMWRFIPRKYTQDVYMYLDIDILILKPLHHLTNKMVVNKMYVMQEGNLTHANYNAAFPESVRKTFTSRDPGYSSGKFACTCPTLRDMMFNEIQNRSHPNDYYCPDQVIYNLVLYHIRDMPIMDTTVLQQPYVILNGVGYDKQKTILYDCAGEPGNGRLHFKKYIDVLALLEIDRL